MEVFVEDLVYARLHQDGIVEGTRPKVVIEVPTRLTTAHLAPVNDIIGDQEETLQLWGWRGREEGIN